MKNVFKSFHKTSDDKSQNLENNTRLSFNGHQEFFKKNNGIHTFFVYQR